MLSLIALVTRLGVPAKFAKPAAIAGLFLLVVAVLALGKCAYDRSIIKQHDASREAATAKADRKADAHAAETRRADDARANTEAAEIKEAINEAGSDPAARRRAYYECVRAIQAARARGKPSPDC